MTACPIDDCLRRSDPDWDRLVRSTGGTLFALARRHSLPDPEAFAFEVLRRAVRDRDCWQRSGLPARVWLCGVALQMARRLVPLSA